MNQSIEPISSQGWGKGGHPKPTPEPSTYGILFVAICLAVILYRKLKS